jgi:hypothetical protein
VQEEATQKTIAFAVKTTKLTAGVLKKLIKMYLDSQKQKANQPKHGKMSIKELVGQNAGVSNIGWSILVTADYLVIHIIYTA